MKPHVRVLIRLRACDEACDFADKYPNMASAWKACQRPSWMWWLIDRLWYYDAITAAQYSRANHIFYDGTMNRKVANAYRKIIPTIPSAGQLNKIIDRYQHGRL